MGRSRPRATWLRPALFVAVVVALIAAGEALGVRQALDPDALRAMGARPTPGLIAAYAALWVLMMGGSVPAVAAGTALFGWVGGTGAALVGAVVAHSAWFGLARTSLRAVVWARGGPRLRWLVTLIDRGGPGLVVAWNLLGAPGGLFLFAAAVSRLPYRVYLLGLLAAGPRFLLTALAVDTLLRWSPADVPLERWGLLGALGLPLLVVYALLLVLRPELRPWRFGDPAVEVEPGAARA